MHAEQAKCDRSTQLRNQSRQRDRRHDHRSPAHRRQSYRRPFGGKPHEGRTYGERERACWRRQRHRKRVFRRWARHRRLDIEQSNFKQCSSEPGLALGQVQVRCWGDNGEEHKETLQLASSSLSVVASLTGIFVVSWWSCGQMRPDWSL